jgi:hypothetical protein
MVRGPWVLREVIDGVAFRDGEGAREVAREVAYIMASRGSMLAQIK